ncbi:MAG: VanZ family protein [Planctomycetaceae bacterium]
MMNLKRISPFAIPTVIRLGVVLLAAVVLTFLLLSSDPSRIFRWLAIRGGRQVYDSTPDWVQHFSAYLLFSFLLQWYAAGKSRWFVPLLAGFAVAHAMTTEYLQQFVPDRTSDVRDLVVNFLGIASGLLLSRVAMWLFDARHPEVEMALQLRPQRGIKTSVRSPGEPGGVGRRTGDDQRVRGLTPSGSPKIRGAVPTGLSRDALTVGLGELQPPRVLRFGVLAGLCVLSVVLIGTVHVVHGWQVKRHSGALMEMGRQAQKAGDLKGARDYIARYVGLMPDDVGALSDYGLLLDQTHAGPRQARQVFMVYEDVLRADPTREEIRRRQIEIAMEAGRSSDALVHVRVLRQSYPTDGKLDYQAGRCFEEIAEYDAAVKSYEAALEHSPDLLDTYARLAWLSQTKLDRPERARNILDEMVARFRTSPTSWLTRGRFHSEFGSLDSALSDLEQARKLAPDAEDVLLASARLAYDRAAAARTEGRDALAQRIVAESRQQLQRGTERHPDQLELRLQRVLLEAHFGAPAEAQRQIEELLKLSPKNAQAHLLLADMTIEQGRFEQARSAIDKLPRTPGSDALRLFLEGRVLMSQQQWPQALETLEQARRITTDSSGLMERTDLALAQCHAAAGEDEAQAAALRRVLKANPVSVPARLGLAALLLKQQRLKEAIAEFRPLAHLPQVRLQLARLLIVRNLQLPELAREWSEIEELLEQAQQQRDDPVNTVLLRAELLAARGQLDAARRVIEEARVTQTDRIEFLIASSRLAERAGETQQANLALGQALSLAGDAAQAEPLLRKAWEKKRTDFAAALALLQHLVRHQQLDAAQTLFKQLDEQQGLRQRPQELAQCYVALHQDEQAVAVYRGALEKQPHDAAALRSLAELHLRRQQLDMAAPLLSRLLDAQGTLPPSEVRWARRQLAVVWAGRGRRHQALALLDSNQQDGSASVDDQRARAFVLASSPRRADQQTAVKLLGELADQNQLLPKDRWLLGRLLESQGQTHEADAHFRAVLDELPDLVEYRAEYVASLIRRGALDDAQSRLAELLRQSPQAFSTMSLEVRLQAARGESASVLKRLEAEAASAGDDAARLGQLAALAGELNHGSLAERLYRRAAEHQPQAVIALVRFLAQTQQVSAAFAVCESAWSRLPAETAAPLALSLLAFPDGRAERLSKLEAKLVAAVEQISRSTSLLTNLADLRCWQERYDEAEELYRRVLSREPNHSAAANNLAWLLALRGRDLDDAAQLIGKLIEQHGPNPQLLDTRGCVYLALRRMKPAVADFITANDEAPSPLTLLHLAIAQAESNDLTAAQATLAQARKLGLKSESLPPLERPWLSKLELTLSR